MSARDWDTIEFIGPHDLAEVAEIAELCHPGWPTRPAVWWLANPTLAAWNDSLIIGHASFSIDPMAQTMYLRDSCVRPEWRGLGVAQRLMEEREAVGLRVGVKRFVGCTWAENAAMIRILEGLGYHRCQRIPGYFAHNDPPADGLVYVKAEA